MHAHRLAGVTRDKSNSKSICQSKGGRCRRHAQSPMNQAITVRWLLMHFVYMCIDIARHNILSPKAVRASSLITWRRPRAHPVCPPIPKTPRSAPVVTLMMMGKCCNDPKPSLFIVYCCAWWCRYIANKSANDAQSVYIRVMVNIYILKRM